MVFCAITVDMYFSFSLSDWRHICSGTRWIKFATCYEAYFLRRYVRWVTPLPILTCGSSSATGANLRCSNKRTPSPSRNGIIGIAARHPGEEVLEVFVGPGDKTVQGH